MNIEVIQAGWLTTIQDTGRGALMRDGITRGGALDVFALRVANILVGNDETCAAFEITLGGFSVKFDDDALIAIGGGDLDAKVADTRIQCWRPVYIKGGGVLSFGQARSGVRAYLAVGGGLDVRQIFGSRSVMMQIESDDLPLRPVRGGDIVRGGVLTNRNQRLAELILKHDKGAIDIKSARHESIFFARWSVSRSLFPAYTEHATLRVIRGREYADFTSASRKDLMSETFRVGSNSNRAGYHLGGVPLHLTTAYEMLSEVVVPGTIQVPHDGAPIILLADCQTHGGYPRIAHVAEVDLPVIAQTKPGAHLRFTEITMDEAQSLHRQRERDLMLLKHALAERR